MTSRRAPARRTGRLRPSAARSWSRSAARRAMLAGLLSLWVGAALPGAALAAGESPEPAVDPFPTVQTWIDGPIEAPPDAPAGAEVQVGATLWSDRDHELFGISGLVVKLYPAKGNAKPSVAPATVDVPGHIVASLPIPEGGPGRIEIATQGQECATDGTCRTVDIPLRISGTGPPPDAPRSSLVTAELLPIVGGIVAGRPAPIAVLLRPIGLWDPEALALPPTMQVLINRVGGGRLGFAELRQDPPQPFQPYEGSLRIPEQGEMALTAALVGAGGTAQPIEGELGRILVTGSGIRPDVSTAPIDRPSPGTGDAPGPGDGPATTQDSGPPIVILIALGVLVVGLGLFLGEPLSRRLRARGGDDRR